MVATKVDYMRAMRHLYRAHEHPELVEVPALRFLMVDGHGDPDGSATFREAVEALYALSYALKFRVKASDSIDYKVLPLEGLWWIPNARVWDFSDKSDWDWTLMIMQPEMISDDLVVEVREQVTARKKLPALDRVYASTFEEGLAAQILHVGPWTAERPTLERLYGFVREEGFIPTGKHHEIYLSDPSKVQPAKLRTIVRHAVCARHGDG
jgi:hypothetical protein